MESLENDQSPCERCGASVLSMLSQSAPLAQSNAATMHHSTSCARKIIQLKTTRRRKKQPNLVKSGAVRNAAPTRATY